MRATRRVEYKVPGDLRVMTALPWIVVGKTDIARLRVLAIEATG